MLFLELDHVSGLGGRFLQVPDLELFLLINAEELAEAGSKALRVAHGDQSLLIFCLLEVELAPLDLGNRALALMVPNRKGRGKALVVDAN